MTLQLFVTFLLLSFAFAITLPEDTGLNITELATKHGYPMETHVVETEDGYHVTMFRIPYGTKNETFEQESRPVVFIMHGLCQSSIDWINRGPENGLGFVLADAGYDVWLGNQRGNYWSLQNEILDYSESNATKFWNFSFHEIGIYDVAAMIDYIIETTSQPKINYIGHSQGGGAFFVLMSSRPEYNEKIKLMIGMAPATFLMDFKSPIVLLGAKFQTEIELAAKLLNIHVLLPQSRIYLKLVEIFCHEGSLFKNFCEYFVELIVGFDSPQFNTTELPVLISYTPAGSSVKQFLHFFQEIKSDKFRPYDYGLLNEIHYGQKSPPDYNLTAVTSPVVIYYGKNDFMVSERSMTTLNSLLPNVKKFEPIANDKWNHLDYMWANDVKELVIDPVLNDLENH